jgi:peptide chain release factor subunit 1
MTYTSKEVFKTLSQSKSLTGGTSLVTMFIPSNYSMSLVTKSLTSELSTASNIKDKSVRKAVVAALKSSLVGVKTSKWHNAPENGLVLCSGETKYCS